MAGVLVCNQDGVIIKSTFNDSNANQMPNTILQIVDKAKDALKDNDELTFIKMKTKKSEFIVVPGILKRFTVFPNFLSFKFYLFSYFEPTDKDFMLITILNTESTA